MSSLAICVLLINRSPKNYLSLQVITGNKMERISVVIITLNEERNIGATLDAALQVADEIIVADNGSTDHTQQICVSKGVSFFTLPWRGFGANRNAAAAKAIHDHILVLDADEVLDENLIKSIRLLKQQGFGPKIYSLQRRNFYYDKFINHGMESADIKPRLYHKGTAQWNDNLVHEELKYPAGYTLAKLDGYLLHYTYRTIAEHSAKTDKYSTLAARQLFESGKNEPGFIKLVLSPAFTFAYAYILKAGFLDGWHGWILAKQHANAVLLKYAKLKILYYEKGKPVN